MDLIERLHFDAVRCHVDYSKGVASNIHEAAAEIDQLRNSLGEALVRENNLIAAIQEWHKAALGMRDLAIKGDCKGIEDLYFNTAMSLPFYGANSVGVNQQITPEQKK